MKLHSLKFKTGLCEIHRYKRFLVEITELKITKRRTYFKFKLSFPAHELAEITSLNPQNDWIYIPEGPFGTETEFETWVEHAIENEKGKFPEYVRFFDTDETKKMLIISKRSGFAMRINYSAEAIDTFKSHFLDGN